MLFGQRVGSADPGLTPRPIASATRASKASVSSLIRRQSSFEYPAVRCWLCCHAAVSPQRSCASSAYSSPSQSSPKISACSAAVNAIPVFFAVIMSSTAATIRVR